MRGNEYADLRAFAAIVEYGTFVRAADALRITPSTLSQIIREMELRLGVRLLNRTTRSVSVTDAGARLIGRLKPALADLDEMVADISGMGGKPVGTLKILAPRIAAEMYLQPLLPRIVAEMPEVHLDITMDDAITYIVAGGFDLGIRLGELLENNMVGVKLGGPLRQIAFASPDYLDRHGSPATPTDLHHHKCINWRQPGSGRPYSWDFRRDDRWFAIAVEGPMTVTDRHMMVDAALSGLGIGFWIEQPVSAHFFAQED